MGEVAAPREVKSASAPIKPVVPYDFKHPNRVSKNQIRTLEDLEATWETLLKIQMSDAELETNPEFMQVAAASDTVLLIAFEINSQHASGLVNLCYPIFTLDPVINLLNVQNWAYREKGRKESEKVYRLSQIT